MAYSIEKLDFFDRDRNRSVPVCLYRPLDTTRCLILFSVGYGGNRGGYAYLARAWSARGLAVGVIEHVGSNLEVLRSLPQKTLLERQAEIVSRVKDPAELQARPRDMAFVLNELGSEFPGLPLGLGGHSFGSFSVLASLGLPVRWNVPTLKPALGRAVSCLLMSPQAPGMLLEHAAYSAVRIPTLVVTGTEDNPLDGHGDFRLRTQVHEALPVSVRNLVVLDGVDHMSFAGIGLNLKTTLKALEALTLQWWERTLFHADGPTDRAKGLRQSIESLITGAVY